MDRSAAGRIVAELDRIDQAAFDASPEFAAYGAGAVRPHVGQGGLYGPDRGLGGVVVGRVRERGHAPQAAGIALDVAGSLVRVVVYGVVARSHDPADRLAQPSRNPSTFRCW